MVFVSFVKTQESTLGSYPYTEGRIFVATDTENLYIDLGGIRHNITNPLKSYPVGSIYIRYCDKNGDNYYATTSPASLFGGSWERLSGEHFLATVPNNGSSLTWSFRSDGIAAGQETRNVINIAAWRRIS